MFETGEGNGKDGKVVEYIVSKGEDTGPVEWSFPLLVTGPGPQPSIVKKGEQTTTKKRREKTCCHSQSQSSKNGRPQRL